MRPNEFPGRINAAKDIVILRNIYCQMIFTSYWIVDTIMCSWSIIGYWVLGIGYWEAAQLPKAVVRKFSFKKIVFPVTFIFNSHFMDYLTIFCRKRSSLRLGSFKE